MVISIIIEQRQPLRGTASAAGERAVAFVGWLELLSAIAALSDLDHDDLARADADRDGADHDDLARDDAIRDDVGNPADRAPGWPLAPDRPPATHGACPTTQQTSQ